MQRLAFIGFLLVSQANVYDMIDIIAENYAASQTERQLPPLQRLCHLFGAKKSHILLLSKNKASKKHYNIVLRANLDWGQ